ncbi:MAG: hypothetical protein HWE18_11250 [Gammaproteobacteria bacterium]|nr:hypothetical protein [Gammaproteobacteria bacterium]
MDILDNCNQIEEAQPSLSEFAQELRLVYEETRQFCAFDESDQLVDTSSFLQNFVDLIHSGFSNLSLNYELLLTGEIGAIFVVALIPLLLGVFLEVTLLISHNRKEFRQEKRQQTKLKYTHGRVLAETIADEAKKAGWGYRAFLYSALAVQGVLIMLFFVTAPEYDRDVWCDEHKTQYAILKAGLETERLQSSQRRANCEIRQAVVAINNSVEDLGSLFSQENNSTLTSIKKISTSLGSSINKLDEARGSINSFEAELKSANANAKSVAQTMNIMQDIAQQLGVNALSKQTATSSDAGPFPAQSQPTLPQLITNIEAQLNQRPEQTWYESQLLLKQDWMAWAKQQQQVNQQLQLLLEQQALTIDELKQQQAQMMSAPTLDRIAEKVVQKLTQQPLYPLMLPSPKNQP